MKKNLLLLLVGIFSAQLQAQNWSTPAIASYGRIVEYKAAAVKPDAEKDCKMFFHITNKKEREGVNASLWKIARTNWKPIKNTIWSLLSLPTTRTFGVMCTSRI